MPESPAPPRKPTPPWVRLGLAAAVAVYLAYSSFGVAAPFWWGHYGYHGATYMLRARTSLRQHMVAPATWTGYDAPVKEALYFHHPIGYHHILTALVPIFGDHEWLARGVAALGGLLALWGLFAVGRRAWGPVVGLVAVWTFVLLPVVTSFSILCDPMLLAFGCVLWSLDAFLQLCEPQTPRRTRRLLLSAAASYAVGGLLMWEGYFIAPLIALVALFWRRRSPQLRLAVGKRSFRVLDLHTVVTGAACAAAMAFHIVFTWRAGALGESVESFNLRHAAPSPQYVIDRHSQWIELLFGAPPVIIGFAWLALLLARALSSRLRRRDLVPLVFLYVNTLYIYLFAEGSSVHLYRVFFFSGFFVYALCDLAVELYDAGRRLGGRAAGLAAALLLLTAYFAAEIPRAWHNLLESRVVGGTHGQPGYNPEREKTLFAQEVHRRTTPDTRVILHYPHLGARKEFWYYIDRSLDEVTELRQALRHQATWKRSVMIFDESRLSEAERNFARELYAKHPVYFFTRFTMIDLREDSPRITSYAFGDLPSTRAWRFFVSHRYPPIGLQRAAWLPGACDALDAGAPLAADVPEERPPPPPPPGDAHLGQCFQHYWAARDGARGVAELGRVLAGLPRHDTPFGGATLIASLHHGAQLRAVFLGGATPPPPGAELRYVVHRRGEPPLTLARGPNVPAPRLWRQGFAYADSVVIPAVQPKLVKPAPPLKPGAKPLPAPPPAPPPPITSIEIQLVRPGPPRPPLLTGTTVIASQTLP